MASTEWILGLRISFLLVHLVVLQALCTAVTEQNLLKTVTQLFAEAEAARLSDSNGHEKHLSLHYSYTQATGFQDLLTHKQTPQQAHNHFHSTLTNDSATVIHHINTVAVYISLIIKPYSFQHVISKLSACTSHSGGNQHFYIRFYFLADSSVYDEIMQPVLYSGYLYKSCSMNKGTLSRRTREGRWQCGKQSSWQKFRSRMCSFRRWQEKGAFQGLLHWQACINVFRNLAEQWPELPVFIHCIITYAIEFYFVRFYWYALPADLLTSQLPSLFCFYFFVFLFRFPKVLVLGGEVSSVLWVWQVPWAQHEDRGQRYHLFRS